MSNKNNWPLKSLNELGFVGRGRSRHRPRNDPSLYGGQYPFIQTAEITASDPYITNYEKTYSEKGLAQSKMWDENILCIVNAGENTCESGILKFKACFPDSVIAFVPYLDKSSVVYIKYYLDSIKAQMRKVTKGATQDNLSVDTLLSFKIPTPPLKNQQKFSKIISGFNDLIENNSRRIKILEEMARMIYQEWFVKFRFPGHEQAKFVESPLGMIPAGWEVRELGEIVSEIIDYRGKTPKKLEGDWSEIGIMALSALNVKQGKLVNLEKSKFVSLELYKKWMKTELQQWDILMTSEAPLGELYLLSKKSMFCLSQRLFSIRANTKIINPVILYYTLSSSSVQAAIQSKATGTTVLGIRQALLRMVLILVPDPILQKKIAPVLENLVTKVETLQIKNQNLRQTRDMLLPKLISGEVDVSDLDIPIEER